MRGAPPARSPRPSPEQREPEDSFALLGPDERLYAAGDHGTLLERRDGRWRAIATHSNADLRWFDGRLAVGLEQRCSICGHIARRAQARERARTHDC